MQDMHISVSQLRRLMASICQFSGRVRWPVPPLNGARVIIIPDSDPRQGWVHMKAR